MKKFLSQILAITCMLMFFAIPTCANASEKVQPRSGGATGTHVEVEKYDSWDENYVFVKYHPETKMWNHSSPCIVIHNSVTVSASVSGSYEGTGIQVGGSMETAADVHFEVDPNKFAKIGIYADYHVVKYKVKTVENWSGKIVSTKYITAKSPVELYQDVVYK